MQKEQMMENETHNPYRLPETAKPMRYDIRLVPNAALFSYHGDEPPPPEMCTFQGTVKIFVNIDKPTDRITLHALELDFDLLRDPHRYVTFPSKKVFPVMCVTFDEEMQEATIFFHEKLPTGQGDFEISYLGKISNNLRGFYLLKYSVKGVTHYGCATQFEATDARGAFPCWDEPDEKAIFKLTLVIPEEVKVFSNEFPRYTAIAGTRGELREVKFRDTEKLSTYLLAWVIADLEYLEGIAVCELGKETKEIPMRVLTTPGKKEWGRFALEINPKILQYFTEYTGIQYPFSKSDLVAPPDFDAGAMENPGLITFRESALLIDPENSSLAALERVANVLAHENAHMWFGDLVTMTWWDGLWLNEGFASYMGPNAVDHLFPHWGVWLSFMFEETFPALHADARRNTHPIEMPVENPAEIGEIFDALTYGKGASINRMNGDYLGDEAMKAGLHAYLKKYAWRNATTNDLWRSLEEASGQPVQDIMAGFTRTPGFPLLSVERTKENPRMLLIEQNRFFADGEEDTSRQLWKVPLTIKVQSGETLKVLIDARAKYILLPEGSSGWVKINFGQSTFCRVKYDEKMLAELRVAVRSKKLPAIDRLGLLSDVMALTRAGHLTSSQALEFLTEYGDEDSYHVLVAISESLDAFDHLLEEEPCHDAFDAYARNFYLPHARQLGWVPKKDEHHLTTKLRSLALAGAGGHGDCETIAQAQAAFAARLESGALDPNLRALVYRLVIKHGGEKEFENLRRLHAASELSEEKRRLMHAMGQVREESMLERFFEFLLSPEVRNQDMPIGLVASAMHAKGRKMTWAFVRKEWKTLVRRYGESRLMGWAIHAASRFLDPDSLQDVRKFFEANPVPIVKRKMAEILEDIEANMHWLERDREDIRFWLAAREVPKVQ